jgi:hypothetical protein
MSEIPEEMNVERLLKQLRPLAPNPEVRERVASDLKLDESWLPRQVRRAPRWLAATGWAGLGAAAAIAVLSALGPSPAVSDGSESVAKVPSALSPSALLNTKQGDALANPGRVWSVENRAWVDERSMKDLKDHPVVAAPEAPARAVLPVNFQ